MPNRGSAPSKLPWGIVKNAVYRWQERKKLPAHKIGRFWKFQLSGIEERVRAGGTDEHDDGEALHDIKPQ